MNERDLRDLAEDARDEKIKKWVDSFGLMSLHQCSECLADINPVKDAWVKGANGKPLCAACEWKADQLNKMGENEDEDYEINCDLCGGVLMILGVLGNRVHYRCRDCGMESSREVNEATELQGHAGQCAWTIQGVRCPEMGMYKHGQEKWYCPEHSILMSELGESQPDEGEASVECSDCGRMFLKRDCHQEGRAWFCDSCFKYVSEERCADPNCAACISRYGKPKSKKNESSFDCDCDGCSSCPGYGGCNRKASVKVDNVPMCRKCADSHKAADPDVIVTKLTEANRYRHPKSGKFDVAEDECFACGGSGTKKDGQGRCAMCDGQKKIQNLGNNLKRHDEAASEITLWAVKQGDADWQEQLITSTADPEKLKKAKVWASTNGFDRLRTATFNPSAKPDFVGAIKREEEENICKGCGVPISRGFDLCYDCDLKMPECAHGRFRAIDGLREAVCPTCKGSGTAVKYDPHQGNWEPANAGTETPFTKNGYRLLYVYQASTGRHAYLNLDTDMILSDEEVHRIFLTPTVASDPLNPKVRAALNKIKKEAWYEDCQAVREDAAGHYGNFNLCAACGHDRNTHILGMGNHIWCLGNEGACDCKGYTRISWAGEMAGMPLGPGVAPEAGSAEFQGDDLRGGEDGPFGGRSEDAEGDGDAKKAQPDKDKPVDNKAPDKAPDDKGDKKPPFPPKKDGDKEPVDKTGDGDKDSIANKPPEKKSVVNSKPGDALKNASEPISDDWSTANTEEPPRNESEWRTATMGRAQRGDINAPEFTLDDAYRSWQNFKMPAPSERPKWIKYFQSQLEDPSQNAAYKEYVKLCLMSLGVKREMTEGTLEQDLPSLKSAWNRVRQTNTKLSSHNYDPERDLEDATRTIDALRDFIHLAKPHSQGTEHLGMSVDSAERQLDDLDQQIMAGTFKGSIFMKFDHLQDIVHQAMVQAWEREFEPSTRTVSRASMTPPPVPSGSKPQSPRAWYDSIQREGKPITEDSVFPYIRPSYQEAFPNDGPGEFSSTDVMDDMDDCDEMSDAEWTRNTMAGDGTGDTVSVESKKRLVLKAALKEGGFNRVQHCYNCGQRFDAAYRKSGKINQMGGNKTGYALCDTCQSKKRKREMTEAIAPDTGDRLSFVKAGSMDVGFPWGTPENMEFVEPRIENAVDAYIQSAYEKIHEDVGTLTQCATCTHPEHFHIAGALGTTGFAQESTGCVVQGCHCEKFTV